MPVLSAAPALYSTRLTQPTSGHGAGMQLRFASTGMLSFAAVVDEHNSTFTTSTSMPAITSGDSNRATCL
jgi:hypothetical protein